MWRDELHRLAFDYQEGCAQAFVPADGFIEAALKGSGIEISLETNGSGKIISRAVWFKLVQKPEPLLRKGERRLLISNDASNGRCCQSAVVFHRLLDAF